MNIEMKNLPLSIIVFLVSVLITLSTLAPVSQGNAATSQITPTTNAPHIYLAIPAKTTADKPVYPLRLKRYAPPKPATATPKATLAAYKARTVVSTALRLEGVALNWAEKYALGHRYCWAGTGPGCYDCSGLVMTALAHTGFYLPHNTVAMVQSGKLVRVWQPQRGDLAFFGPVGAPFHVEFVTIWRDTSFGAHDYGAPVGWATWGGWWQPSAYYRILT